MSKKSNYKVIAEGIMSGDVGRFKLPTNRVDHRKLTIDEIKEFMIDEFKKVMEAKGDVKPQEFPGGWGDAELAHEINWAKALKLQEHFYIDKE